MGTCKYSTQIGKATYLVLVSEIQKIWKRHLNQIHESNLPRLTDEKENYAEVALPSASGKIQNENQKVVLDKNKFISFKGQKMFF